MKASPFPSRFVRFASACVGFVALTLVCAGQATAPSSLAGRSAVVLIASGTGAFAASGGYRITFSGSGATYFIAPLTPVVAASNGTYTYTRTSNTSATLTVTDSLAGAAVAQTIVFNSLASGSFSVQSSLGTQSGTLVLEGGPAPERLINLATRGRVGTGGDVLIAGLVVDGSANKRLLLRAVGPQLGQAPFNVPGVLEDPVLEVFNASGALIASNDDWTPSVEATFAQVGAFSLFPGSRDSALLVSLAPGAYTAQVRGKEGRTGVALVEAYEIPY